MNEIVLNELTSKSKIARLAREYRDEIIEGEINPLMAAAILKAMEDFTKTLRADILIKDAVKTELDKYPEKTIKFSGVTFQKKRVGTKYIYDETGDPVYIALKKEQDAILSRVKDREEFLKNLPDGGLEIIDDETGEVVRIYKAVAQYEEGYSIMLSD